MIEAIRIQNLRSLKDTGYIDIKPLTILVGVNSSGKSSFLRSFPLFTQSITKDLRGVISWYNDSLVDLGSYSTAKSRFAENTDTIKFSYKIDYKSLKKNQYFVWGTLPFTLKEIKNLEISISLKYSELDNEEYVNEVCIILNNQHNINYSINDKNGKVKFKIDREEITFQNVFLFNNQYRGPRIIPYIVESKNNTEEYDNFSVIYSSLREKGINVPYANEILQTLFGPTIKINENYAKIITEITKLWSIKKEEFIKKIQNHQFNNTSIDKIINKWTISNKDFEKIYNIILLLKVSSLLPWIDRDICNFYNRCSYIAPVRAVADSRVIRDQNLQVRDIDPEGKNLREVLKSLSLEQKKSYDNFTEKILNIKVEVKTEQTLLSLYITQGKEKFNIMDVGFGYSQILPIITKLWLWHYYGSNRSDKSILLFEQPELHLHPAYQAKIADAFINAIINKHNKSMDTDDLHKGNMNLIIETHSQTIINRIGRRIYEGYLSPSDVNIVIFEKNYNEQYSNVRQTSFDKKGKITDWPRGFFDPLDEPLFN